MSGIDVESKVSVYEVDGEEKIGEDNHILVKSDWKSRERVILVFPGSLQEFTVLRRDLEAAITNACNTGGV